MPSNPAFNLSFGYRALPPGPRTILFISEPLEAMPLTNVYDGYNEKRILDHVIYALESLSKERDEDYTVLVWVPECQDTNDFNYLGWWTGRATVHVTQAHLYQAFELADLVVGMASNELVSAAMCNRPCISIRPRQKKTYKKIDQAEGIASVYRIIDLPESIETVMYSTRVRRYLHEGCQAMRDEYNRAVV